MYISAALTGDRVHPGLGNRLRRGNGAADLVSRPNAGARVQFDFKVCVFDVRKIGIEVAAVIDLAVCIEKEASMGCSQGARQRRANV